MLFNSNSEPHPTARTSAGHQDKQVPSINGRLYIRALDSLNRDLDSSIDKLASLKKVFHEIAVWLVGERKQHLWPMRVFAQTFYSKGGECFHGSELLALLAHTNNDISDPKDRYRSSEIEDGAEIQQLFFFNCLRELGFTIDPGLPRAYQPDEVNISQAIKKDDGLKPSGNSQLIEVMHEILEKQFAGNILSFSFDIIRNSTYIYGQQDKERCSGKLLLQELFKSQWLQEHPDHDGKTQAILGQGKQQEKNLIKALDSFKLTILLDQIGLMNRAVELVVDGFDAGTTSAEIAKLAIVAAINQIALEQRQNLSLTYPVYTCRVAPDSHISLEKLVEIFQVNRFREECPNLAERLDSEILSTYPYRVQDALDYICNAFYLVDSAFPKSFKDPTFTDQLFEQFTKLHGLDVPLSIIGHSADDAQAIHAFLRVAGEEIFTGRSLTEFIARYIGLEISDSEHSAKNWSYPGLALKNKVLTALMYYFAHNRDCQLDEMGIQCIKYVLKSTIRDEASNSGEELIKKLELDANTFNALSNKAGLSEIESARYLRMSKLYLEVAEEIKKDWRFEVPFLKSSPFFYQREALRFLFERRRAILADDTGLGKTFEATGAALAYIAQQQSISNLLQYSSPKQQNRSVSNVKYSPSRILWVADQSDGEVLKQRLIEEHVLSQSDVYVFKPSENFTGHQIINSSTQAKVIIVNKNSLIGLHQHRDANNLFKVLTQDTGVIVLETGQSKEVVEAQIREVIDSIATERIGYLPAVSNAESEVLPIAKAALSYLNNRTLHEFKNATEISQTVATPAPEYQPRRVLWVTHVSNLENVKQQILKHYNLSDRDICIIRSDVGVRRRERAINNIDRQTFIIVNYDTLRTLHKGAKTYDLFRTLTKDIAVLIRDESQTIENEQTQRSSAVKSIYSECIWSLSATPYQNRYHKLIDIIHELDPVAYPKPLMRKLIHDVEGLEKLYLKTLPLILRRSKSDLVKHFDDPGLVTFEQQLAGGVARIPKFHRLHPSTCSYQLNSEQQQTIAWMISDFRSWAHEYNLTCGPGERRINLANLNPLQKFDWLHKAIFQPELLNLKPADRMYEYIDKFIQDRVNTEKIIIWAWNTRVVNDLIERYQLYSPARIDGTQNSRQHAKAVDRFQNNDECRLIICNYRSGGVGLTLNAATTALVVQPPYTYPATYQLESRPCRVIGAADIRHAKTDVYAAYVTPTFDPDFIASLYDRQLAGKLQAGTLVEQTVKRLEQGRILFELTMNGKAIDLKGDPNKILLDGLFHDLGLSVKDDFESAFGLSLLERKRWESAKQFLPVQDLYKGNEQLTQLLSELIEVFSGDRKFAELVSQKLLELGTEVESVLLKCLVQAGQLKHRKISQEFTLSILNIKNLFELTNLEGNKLGNQLVVNLNQILQERSGVDQNVLPASLIDYLLSQKDSPDTRYLKERLFIAVYYLCSKPEVIQWLSNLALDLEQTPADQLINTLFELACASKVSEEVIGRLKFCNAENVNLWSKLVKQECNLVLEKFAQTPAGAVAQLISEDSLWTPERLSKILGLVAAQIDCGNERQLAQTREVIATILNKEFNSRRRSDDWQEGNKLTFMRDDREFWGDFTKNVKIISERVFEDRKLAEQQLVADYFSLRFRLMQNIAGAVQSEGKIVEHYLYSGSSLTQEERELLISDLDQMLNLVGHLLNEFNEQGSIESVDNSKRINDLFGKRLPASIANQLINRSDIAGIVATITIGLELYSSELENPDARFSQVLQKLDQQNAEHGLQRLVEHMLQQLSDIRRLREWVVLDLQFNCLSKQPESLEFSPVKEALKRKLKFYSGQKLSAPAALIDSLNVQVNHLENYSKKSSSVDVTIEETDHPALLLTMGELSNTLINCYSSFRDPGHSENFWAIGACGSRNFKLLLARDNSGRILAAAGMKVRSTLTGRPVLFLERGIAENGWNFNQQFQDFVAHKAMLLNEAGHDCLPAVQVLSSSRPDDITVQGTGAYTDFEYAEPCFKLRDPFKVAHRARLLSKSIPNLAKITESRRVIEIIPPKVIQNRPLNLWVNKLIQANVGVVIHVSSLDKSQSQSKKRMKEELQHNGIRFFDVSERILPTIDGNLDPSGTAADLVKQLEWTSGNIAILTASLEKKYWENALFKQIKLGIGHADAVPSKSDYPVLV